MKIIHCADIHLDSRLGNLGHNQAILRRGEILESFCDLISQAEQNKDAVVIVAGDLFESRFAAPSTKAALINCFAKHPTVKILILTGNHDQSAFDEEFIKRLPQNVILFGEGIKSYQLDDVHFVGVDLLTVTQQQMLQIDWQPQDYNVLICHGDKGKTSSDYGNIDLDAFYDKPIDYFAMGHIHTSDKEPAGRGFAAYSGCLEPRGFDETGDKGFMWINTDCLDRNQSIQFVRFAKRRAFSINVDVSNCLDNAAILQTLSEFVDGKTILSSDMVEFYLCGQVEETCIINCNSICSALSKNLFSVKVKDKTKVKLDLDKIKSQQTIKAKFILTAENTIADADLLEKVLKYGLNALNGEEIDTI